MKFASLVLILLGSITVQAYIPPARMILQRTADNSGSGAYQIEQELQFPNGAEPLLLKETWLVENDRSMRVTVTGQREFSTLRWQILYGGGQKWSTRGGGTPNATNISADFVERFFHVRSGESLATWLMGMKILPAGATHRKALPRKSEDIRYQSEDFVRLARTGGSVAWAFGTPAAAEGTDAPAGIWIEQDQFVIRKIRLPSGADITAENLTSYPRGLIFPKTRTIRWGPHSVNINVLSINAKPNVAGQLTPSRLEAAPRNDLLKGQPAQSLIEEFYSRFR